jgi:hypothetical protein
MGSGQWGQTEFTPVTVPSFSGLWRQVRGNDNKWLFLWRKCEIPGVGDERAKGNEKASGQERSQS